jgi:hypothetical protein
MFPRKTPKGTNKGVLDYYENLVNEIAVNPKASKRAKKYMAKLVRMNLAKS